MREAFEFEISGGRKVLMAEAATEDMEKIYAYANFTGEEPAGQVLDRTAKIGAQMALISVDGEKLTFETARERWKELFPKMRDAEAVKRAWLNINFPDGATGNAVPVPVTIG